MGNVAAESSIGVGFGEATSGLSEGEPVVCELLSKVSQLTSSTDYLGFGRAMAHDFCSEGVIVLLSYSPVDSFSVQLSFGKEELLPEIEGRAWVFVWASMEGAGVDWAGSPQGA